jgi:hypothetical protein
MSNRKIQTIFNSISNQRKARARAKEKEIPMKAKITMEESTHNRPAGKSNATLFWGSNTSSKIQKRTKGRAAENTTTSTNIKVHLKSKILREISIKMSKTSKSPMLQSPAPSLLEWKTLKLSKSPVTHKKSSIPKKIHRICIKNWIIMQVSQEKTERNSHLHKLKTNTKGLLSLKRKTIRNLSLILL